MDTRGRPSQTKIATEEIETWRREHKLTQMEMAGILGLTRGQYEGYERTGEFPCAIVQRFEKYLDLYKPVETDRASVLYYSEKKQVYLNVDENGVKVVRCAGQGCTKLIVQRPARRKYCNQECKDRGRKR